MRAESHPETLGAVGRLMRTAPTLRHALLDLVTHQHRHASGAAIYLLEQDSVLFGYAVYQAATRALDQVLDGAALAAFAIVRELLRLEDGRGLRVCIAARHPPTSLPIAPRSRCGPGSTRSLPASKSPPPGSTAG